MMRSAITVSLVPEAAGGPFVFWNGLEDAFEQASRLGFDAVEIFPPGPEALEVGTIQALCARTGLRVAAVGTGAGWVKHRLHLCSPDAEIRRQSREFLGAIIERAGELGAPAILGSMQGRVEAGVERGCALEWLSEALQEAGAKAASGGQVFLYEPLNRYETNLWNRQGEALAFLQTRGLSGVRVLADLFHMNLEESNLPEAIRGLGPALGHVHFADSNRRAIGFGHTEIGPVFEALREIGYAGYLSAEVLPLPTSAEAARQTIASFRSLMSPQMPDPKNSPSGVYA